LRILLEKVIITNGIVFFSYSALIEPEPGQSHALCSNI